MVFVSMNMTLEEFLDKDINTRLENLDWFLFDKTITSKNISLRTDNIGNLRTYIYRIMFYPFYYKEPLHLYLIDDKAFKKMEFLTEEQDKTACIWNMKRIPDGNSKKKKYKKVKKADRLWNDEPIENEDFVTELFEQLVSQTGEIAHVCVS